MEDIRFDTSAAIAFVEGHLGMGVQFETRGDETLYFVDEWSDKGLTEDEFMELAEGSFGELCGEIDWSEKYCLDVADWSPFNIFYKRPIKEVVDEGVEDLLSKLYHAGNILNGDITPEQQVRWDKIIGELSDLFGELKEQNSVTAI